MHSVGTPQYQQKYHPKFDQLYTPISLQIPQFEEKKKKKKIGGISQSNNGK